MTTEMNRPETAADRLQAAMKLGYKAAGGANSCSRCAHLRRASDGALACRLLRVHVDRDATCAKWMAKR
ncbi:hypothetical protein [Arenimonas sp.]|uniref:hypothetical protein n=1 Tax=Arenimonas sp. TaxID=1872635 RepID=UPI0025C0A662|nr:hypothetical protein [Arenimonas sp.]